jgi:hypothetical protein
VGPGALWGSITGSCLGGLPGWTGEGDPQNLYDGTTSWDAQAGDTAAITFSGTQARLYGVRDSNEGIGDVSVDGGPPVEVDFYARTPPAPGTHWCGRPRGWPRERTPSRCG